MKKLAFLFSVILAIMTSCKQETDQESHAEDLISYEKIGILHNDGLDSFLTEIKLLSTSTKGGVESLDKKALVDVKNAVIINVMSKLFENTVSSAEMQSMIGITTKTTSYKSMQETESDLSNIQKQFSEELEMLILTENNINKFGQLSNKLLEKYSFLCDGKEFQYLKIQAVVVVNSFKYWQENFDEWNKVFCGILTRSQISAKDVIIADGIGAAAGAIKGGMTGAAGGTIVVPGVGTAGGAIVGAIGGGLAGAVEASICAGIGAWVSSWFD